MLCTTAIVGLGNDLLSDDGVGLYVVRRLRGQLDPKRYEVIELSVGGMELVERLAGFRRAILIDACRTGRYAPGTVTRHRAEEFANSPRLASYHTMDFGTALELARQLGAKVPEEIVVFAIEVEDVETIGESCTPNVEAAIETAARAVMEFVESH
ncbi:MAG: hydrogenase maturation protease [Candidatus Sumerlaeia bacterium]|nr:hydrogenase maturation protease [Candidatus Sumerlaeia bacterium]